MEDKTTLADLTKLLDFGFLTEPCSVKTPNGEFRFELKTMTPLEEAHAQQRVAQLAGNNENAKNIHTAIEYLARSIQTVNNVPLEEHPMAKNFNGNALDKKREVVARFSEGLMLPLWESYQKLRTKAVGTTTPEEDEAIKK